MIGYEHLDLCTIDVMNGQNVSYEYFYFDGSGDIDHD